MVHPVCSDHSIIFFCIFLSIYYPIYIICIFSNIFSSVFCTLRVMCIICVHCASCVLRLFYSYLLRRCIIYDAYIHILISSYSPRLHFELPASLMPRKGCGEKFLFREALRWVEETWPAPPLQLNLNLQHFSEIQNIFLRNVENIYQKYRNFFLEM